MVSKLSVKDESWSGALCVQLRSAECVLRLLEIEKVLEQGNDMIKCAHEATYLGSSEDGAEGKKVG